METGSTGERSGGFFALWREVGRGSEAARKGLRVTEIVAAAVEIADERGLSEVSMARVAKHLGYSTMALYRHVSGKDELLALMFDAGVAGLFPDILEHVGWRARMHAYARSFAAIFRRRPWLIDIPITGPPIGPNNIAVLNLGLTILEETGLDVADCMEVFMLMTNFMLGQQRTEIEIARASEGARFAGIAADESSYGRVLSELMPPGRFLAVETAIAAGLFEGDGGDPDEELRRMVDHILDGVEALMARRGVSKTECRP